MMKMMIVVIRTIHLAYRSVTNENNVLGDAVNAFVYVKIAGHSGFFVLREGECLYICDVSVIDVIFSPSLFTADLIL